MRKRPLRRGLLARRSAGIVRLSPLSVSVSANTKSRIYLTSDTLIIRVLCNTGSSLDRAWTWSWIGRSGKEFERGSAMRDETSTQDLKERLELIESMIAEGRRSNESWGWVFLLWGVAYYVAIGWATWGWRISVWG